jgi:hypothetical protein
LRSRRYESSNEVAKQKEVARAAERAKGKATLEQQRAERLKLCVDFDHPCSSHLLLKCSGV